MKRVFWGALLALPASALLAQDSDEPQAHAPDHSAKAEVAPAPPVLVPPPAPPAPPAPPEPVPVTELAASADKLEWFQSPVLFLPNKVEGGKKNFLENETIFEAPLVWAVSARLAGDVTIAGPGEPVELKAGDILPIVSLKKERGVDARYTLYCTRNKITQVEQNGGIFGKLGQQLAHSMRDAQWCLQDTDRDDKFDLAVVLNAGAPVSQAAPIEPVAFEELTGEPIQGDGDRLQIQLNRVGKKDVGLWMSIKQRGSEMQFQSITSLFYNAQRFTNIRYTAEEGGAGSVFGIQFRISDADRKGNSATIEWIAPTERAFPVVIPTELRTTYY